MNNQESSMNTRTMPEGQELLQGLYTVHNYLAQVDNRLTARWQLENEYRSTAAHIGNIQHIPYINPNNVQQKSLFGLFVAGMAFSIISAITALFSGNIANVIFCII